MPDTAPVTTGAPASVTRGPSKRRSQAQRRAESRNAILEAAITCFNRAGYHAATMAEIAREAGVSKGLLHYHFDTKEKLMIAVEQRMAERIFESITDTASQLEPSVKQALWALDELWDNVVESRQMIPIVVELAARSLGDDEMKERFVTMNDLQFQLLEEGIRRVLGPIQDQVKVDVSTIADLVMVTLGGLAMASVTSDPDRPEDIARFDRAFQTFKKMLLTYVLPDELQQEVPNE